VVEAGDTAVGAVSALRPLNFPENSRSQGVFAGLSLEEAVVKQDEGDNREL
jgi:lipid-binding SYLF domain-containing protein